MKVLIVDDQPINRLLPMTLLRKRGIEVVEAEDGDAALRLVAEFQPDLVLLDISMPGRGGIEICRLIRQSHPPEALRVVAYTAHSSPEEHEVFLAAGFDSVLIKPIQRDALFAIVEPARTA